MSTIHFPSFWLQQPKFPWTNIPLHSHKQVLRKNLQLKLQEFWLPNLTNSSYIPSQSDW